MSAPTACWQPFPFLDHRTCADVSADDIRNAQILRDIIPEAIRRSSKLVEILEPAASHDLPSDHWFL